MIPRTAFACMLLASTSAASAADAPRSGSFTVSFSQTTPLADGHEVSERLGMGSLPPGQTLIPADESWHVYVPEDYSGSAPYGVLVWVSPSDSGELPAGWQHVLKEYKLIYVAADESGNTQDVITRRVPLALTGLAGIEAAYQVDATRIYVGGFSGGGVTASHIAAGYADVFTGGLFVSTSHGIGTTDMPVPALPRLQAMRTRGRYVFTAGMEETDNQIMTTRAVDAFRALCVLRVEYIHIPNAGHGNLDSRVLVRALKYLDAPADPSQADESGCRQALARRRADAVSAIHAAVQAGDRPKAQGLLRELETGFGPLAEPDYSSLVACLDAQASQVCPAAAGG